MGSYRKKFWVDAPLQLRVLTFVLILIVFSLGLAYLAANRGLEQAAAMADRTFVSVAWAQGAMRAPFAVAGAISIAAGGMITVLWTHRLIGPLMVLTAGLRRLAGGDLSRGLDLRATDVQFETTREFERLRQSLREQAARLSDVERRLRGPTPKDDELRSIRDELAEIVAFFKR